MADSSKSVQDLKDLFRKFVTDRDWEQFHTPKNLSMSLSVEAAELMEHFLWMENQESLEILKDEQILEEVADEIADVAGHIFCLCNTLNLDLSDIIARKMAKNVVKYPAETYRGKYSL